MVSILKYYVSEQCVLFLLIVEKTEIIKIRKFFKV